MSILFRLTLYIYMCVKCYQWLYGELIFESGGRGGVRVHNSRGTSDTDVLILLYNLENLPRK